MMTLTLAPETEARLLAASAETGLAPEEVIDALLRQDASEPVQDTPEQARLRAVFFELIAEAQALEPVPAEERPEQALEERLFGEIITEKYRKQGFNLVMEAVSGRRLTYDELTCSYELSNGQVLPKQTEPLAT